VATEYRSEDWDRYKMVVSEPHRELESLEDESRLVDGVLATLHDAGIVHETGYDGEKFLAHRKAVQELFEIPWTAITPRIQRLLYALNAIHKPARMIAAGVFCGNTFISNAGAAVGPGACYDAKALIGVEIKPEEAQRAERNVRKIDPTGVARVVAADAVDLVRDFADPIDLLYLDADGAGNRGKGVYLDILEAGLDRMPSGALVLAHNSLNSADALSHYLAFVREGDAFGGSVNVIVDGEGLEVSVKR
jgi:predicted O-methyltransferase YrrM